MKSAPLTASSLLVAIAFCALGANHSRDWKSGILLEAETQEVHTGKHTTTNSNGTIKDKDNKTDYSQTTTSTTTDDNDTFQVYTIQGDTKTHVAREQLLFPWSKPANVTVGEKVKYFVQKNTLYLPDDAKQHKAGISKVSLNRDAVPK